MPGHQLEALADQLLRPSTRAFGERDLGIPSHALSHLEEQRARLPAVGLERGQPERVGPHVAALEPVVREYDCLSSLGPHEIAVLAHGIDNEEAPILADNLAQLVADAFPEAPEDDRDVCAGFAVFDLDSTDAGSLIGIARERLMRSRQRPLAEPDPLDAVA